MMGEKEIAEERFLMSGHGYSETPLERISSDPQINALKRGYATAASEFTRIYWSLTLGSPRK